MAFAGLPFPPRPGLDRANDDNPRAEFAGPLPGCGGLEGMEVMFRCTGMTNSEATEETHNYRRHFRHKYAKVGISKPLTFTTEMGWVTKILEDKCLNPFKDGESNVGPAEAGRHVRAVVAAGKEMQKALDKLGSYDFNDWINMGKERKLHKRVHQPEHGNPKLKDVQIQISGYDVKDKANGKKKLWSSIY